MSTNPFPELPSRDQGQGHAGSQPAFFPASECPLPSRFWKVALELDCWSPAEQSHLTVCPHCRSVQERVSAAARTARGPSIGSAVDLPIVQQPPPPRPAPELSGSGGWFRRSWLGQGLRLLGSFWVRLAPRPAACQRPPRRQRLGLDPLEDRDVLSGFFPWHAGWQAGMMVAADPGDRGGPVVVAETRPGSEVAVPGTPAPEEQAWLSAFAALVWSAPAPEAAGAGM
jgi:hypothetical protein